MSDKEDVLQQLFDANRRLKELEEALKAENALLTQYYDLAASRYDSITRLESKLSAALVERDQAKYGEQDVQNQLNGALGRLDSCLEGQEALKAQTVRIRAALTDERREGVDTEQIAKELVGRLDSATSVLLRLKQFLNDERWGTINYMEGSEVYRHLREHADLIDSVVE